MSIDTLPINWHPEWPGVCDGTKDGEPCLTEQIKIVADFDDDFFIQGFELWGECPWCGKNWTLPVPYTKKFDRSQFDVVE
jgi:hypothetical protein